MEEFTDDQINSLAVEWVEKIKSKVGLTDLMTPTWPDTFPVEQVQLENDVIYRSGGECCTLSRESIASKSHNFLANDKKIFNGDCLQSGGNLRTKKDCMLEGINHGTDLLRRDIEHAPTSSLISGKSLDEMKANNLRIKKPHAENGVTDTSRKLWSSTENQDRYLHNSVFEKGSVERRFKAVREKDQNCNMKDRGEDLEDIGHVRPSPGFSSNEDQDEIFAIWDFDDEQRKTAIKYLNETKDKKIGLNPINQKENIVKNDLKSHMAYTPTDEYHFIKEKEKTACLKDVTNMGHSSLLENDLSMDEYTDGNQRKCDAWKNNLDSSFYYKSCPVCKEFNKQDANWCEECGKALVSVEIRKFTPNDDLKRENSSNGMLVPSKANHDGHQLQKCSKLNPNSAEFVSVLSKSNERQTVLDNMDFNLNSKTYNSLGSALGCRSRNSTSQLEDYRRQSQGEVYQNLNTYSQSDHNAMYPQYFSHEQGVTFGKSSFSPKMAWSPNHYGVSPCEHNRFDLGNTNFQQPWNKGRLRSNSLQQIVHANTVPSHSMAFSYPSLSNHDSFPSHELQYYSTSHQQLQQNQQCYQGFDFQNPQLELNASEPQAFDELSFSKQFVEARLCHQIQTFYGSPEPHQPSILGSLDGIPNINMGPQNIAVMGHPSFRMYSKKKNLNYLESPRSPVVLSKRNKKGRFRTREKTKPRQDIPTKKEIEKYSQSSVTKPIEETPSNVHVPPLALEDLETYDQVLTLIRTAKEEALPYLCLPEEVILYIFSYLSKIDLCRCARVCKQFHRISTDDCLWKEITLRKRNDLSDEILGKIGEKCPISLTLTQCHSNKVSEEGLRDLFRKCGDTLQDLDFSACSGKALVGELILLHVSSRCKKLRSLDISWSNVSDIGVQAFSEAVERLECICLNGCQAITDESIRCIASKHSESIRVLEMFGCFNISHVSLSILQKHCTNIETLNMGQCHKVTDASVAELAKQMPKLENIDLRGCKQIRNGAVKGLALNCPFLSTLVIANCPLITDASLAFIAANTPKIRCLDVCGCTKISDQGIQTLAKSCNKLEILDLSSTKASDKAIISLANYCHQTLNSLKLSFCHSITEISLEQLAKKCKRLKLLHLYGCKRVRNLTRVEDLNKKLIIER